MPVKPALFSLQYAYFERSMIHRFEDAYRGYPLHGTENMGLRYKIKP